MAAVTISSAASGMLALTRTSSLTPSRLPSRAEARTTAARSAPSPSSALAAALVVHVAWKGTRWPGAAPGTAREPLSCTTRREAKATAGCS